MRIQIKTKNPIKDKDIRALYILDRGVNESSNERMKLINLRFIVDRLGYKIVPKSDYIYNHTTYETIPNQ